MLAKLTNDATLTNANLIENDVSKPQRE